MSQIKAGQATTLSENIKSMPLGYCLPEIRKAQIGFVAEKFSDRKPKQKEIRYSGDGHFVTIGPTGSGKSRGSAIPALLSHQGPAIVVDVKGELYNTTARYRREIGQQVYKLDPWALIDDESDSLNPLDLMQLPGSSPSEEAGVMAKLLAGQESCSREPFWDQTADAINSGIIDYLAHMKNPADRRLSKAREMLVDDFSYNIAVILDSVKDLSLLAAEEFKIFLQHPERETRPSIQSTAQTRFRLFGTPALKKVMDTSTIPLQDLIDGKPMTIYLVIPPHKVESHAEVLRVWLGVLLQALSHRQQRGRQSTLFLVDEAASLGKMGPLKRAITLLRGYGVQVWTFWQDASQIKALYPDDWQTIINNADVVQLLGSRNYRMAEEYASLVGGLHPEQVFNMDQQQQILLSKGHREAKVCERLDYLSDEMFAGKYDNNPLFSTSAISVNKVGQFEMGF